VEAHGVRERRVEDFVIAGGDELENGGKSIARGLGEIAEICDGVSRQ
jgi:hypothetical protein